MQSDAEVYASIQSLFYFSQPTQRKDSCCTPGSLDGVTVYAQIKHPCDSFLTSLVGGGMVLVDQAYVLTCNTKLRKNSRRVQ